jgi:asparagine synthetase B (glutamine-hydrolysing)
MFPLCIGADMQIIATIASWPQLHSFSIGLENSPDLLAARKAAHYLGTVHHEYVFTVQEGLDAIPDVIYHLETYDVTTVRASTPMYLLSRKIKAMGVKMVLSGEGSDEVFGGMLISCSFAPDRRFNQSLVRLPLFPQGSRRKVFPPRMCPPCEEPSHGRLLACQQVCLDLLHRLCQC